MEQVDLTMGSDQDDAVEVEQHGATQWEAEELINADLQGELHAVEHELQKVERDVSRLLKRKNVLLDEQDRIQRAIQVEQLAPRRDWGQAIFEWDAEVKQTLQEIFGLQTFRPLQLNVINATMQGRDVLALLPSGGGKSLLYQLPALLPGPAAWRGGASAVEAAHCPAGLTLVISPLLSLIWDQVAALEALGIKAACMTSASSKTEIAEMYAMMDDLISEHTAHKGGATKSKPGKSKSGKGGSHAEGKASVQAAHGGGVPGRAAALRLLYVTPERVAGSKRLLSKLEKLYEVEALSRIAVDEAHCVSQWGNDFRPDMKKLSILRTMFPKCPIAALTATATQHVRQDVSRILGIEGAELFSASINRPNLFYEVVEKPATQDELVTTIAQYIQQHMEGESGIVYALTRKDCEVIAEGLSKEGIGACAYHADMQPEQRKATHEAWSSGGVQCVVCTIAFGMGINKTDCRFVIHSSMSKSVENYYQESGRAGRDGKPARCLLFYRLSDCLRQAGIVCFESGWWAHLKAMTQYAAGRSCRRAALQAHFAEAPAPCRGMCYRCLCAHGAGGAPRTLDIQEHVKSVLRTLEGMGTAQHKATLKQLLDAWKKDKGPGGCRALPLEEQEQVVESMLLGGILQLDIGATAYATNVYLAATDTGKHLLDNGGAVLSITLRQSSRDLVREVEQLAEERAGLNTHAQAVAEALHEWRVQVAMEQQLLPECVLGDQSLLALSQMLEPDLQQVQKALSAHTSQEHVAAALSLLQHHLRSEAGNEPGRQAKRCKQ